MDEETMNLDLNLVPLDPNLVQGLAPIEPMNLEDWMARLQQLQQLWRQNPASEETNIALNLMVNSGVGVGLQSGEGSVVSEDRNPENREIPEAIKTCENHNTDVEDEVLGKKGDTERVNGDGGSFFDCNICLELATDPIVTCCGHLFCWPCIYQWLHVHSHTNECPVCKGEVTIKGVVPIYGRGNNTHNPKDHSIPKRPVGNRVESWRQTSDFPIEEIVGGAYEEAEVRSRSLPERSRSFLNRVLNTSGGVRREQNTNLLRRRSHSHRTANLSNLTSVLTSAERLIDSYLRDHPVAEEEVPNPHVDDTDSLSSIAAVILSESQTAVEIDSTVSVSTASSRRQNDGSRVSDIDSGDSRAPRRRRLN